MKTILAGSRTITDYALVCAAVDESGFDVTEVVSGHAAKSKVDGTWRASVDQLGERWSREFLDKEPTLFPADWEKYDRRAGYIRNQQMADYAEALIAVWDGESRGTKHMIDCAKNKGLQVYVHRTDE